MKILNVQFKSKKIKYGVRLRRCLLVCTQFNLNFQKKKEHQTYPLQAMEPTKCKLKEICITQTESTKKKLFFFVCQITKGKITVTNVKHHNCMNTKHNPFGKTPSFLKQKKQK